MSHGDRSLVVGLTGRGGFVGSAVARAVENRGHRLRPITVPRLALPEGGDLCEFIRLTLHGGEGALDGLASNLEGCDVVVHAAGLAEPESPMTPRLVGANAALPAVVAHAARVASVRRFVHVSSAAVQGSLDPLDESMRHAPRSPYARSKAMGESQLGAAAPAPAETVIFRPTSVQGCSRAMTASLCRLIRARFVPVFGGGDAPLPLALVENVAAAIVAILEAVAAPPVVLYPWEGMTFRRLMSLAGSGRAVPVPRFAGQAAVAGLLAAGAISSRGVALGRRLELLVRGQRQEAAFLPQLGFVPPIGDEGYRALCGVPAEVP